MMFTSRVFSLVAVGLAAFSGLAQANPVNHQNRDLVSTAAASVQASVQLAIDVDPVLAAIKERKDDITYILTEDINKIYQALDKAAATVNALEVYAVTTVDAAAQEVLDKAVAVISEIDAVVYSTKDTVLNLVLKATYLVKKKLYATVLAVKIPSISISLSAALHIVLGV